MNSYILVQFVWKLVGKKAYDTLLAKFLLDTTKVFCAQYQLCFFCRFCTRLQVFLHLVALP